MSGCSWTATSITTSQGCFVWFRGSSSSERPDSEKSEGSKLTTRCYYAVMVTGMTLIIHSHSVDLGPGTAGAETRPQYGTVLVQLIEVHAARGDFTLSL